MAAEFKKRYTAFKMPIGLLMRGMPQFEKTDDGREKFSFLAVEDREINRVNVIATVVDKYDSAEKTYAALTIDDGTDNIRIKTFSDVQMLKDIQLGDTVVIIGLLRVYNDELYIQPELVKHTDPRWLLARKLELESDLKISYDDITAKEEPGEVQQPLSENEEIAEEKIESGDGREPSLREGIISIIRDAEPQEGIGIDEVIMKLKHPVDEIKNAVTDLLEAGEIFEPRPGKLRML